MQRFYRVPCAEGEGTGLCLAIADEIAYVLSATLQLEAGSTSTAARAVQASAMTVWLGALRENGS